MNAPLAPIASPPEDARFDPRFESLRAEIAKLETPSAGPVDWSKVETLAVEVLSHVVKDALVAAYLAVGACRTRGLLGLCEGLEIVRGLFATFGEALEPRRPRARANALAWLVEHGARAIDERGLIAGGVDGARIGAALESLVGVVDGALGEQAPSFAPLREALARASADPVPEVDATPEVGARPEVEATPDVHTSPASVACVTESPRVLTLASLSAEYLEPISTDAPTGADARYEAAYVWLDREFAKLVSATGDVPDWKRVLDECDRMLRTHTKDLLLACYLALAWVELEGMSAAPRAIALPAALLERFGETLHPPASRPKRRANALAFLFERIVPRIASHAPTADDRELADTLRALARSVAAVVRDALGDDAPPTRALLDEAERFVLGVPAQRPLVPPELPAGSNTNPASAPSVAHAQTALSAPVSPALATPQILAAPASLDDLVPYLSRTGQGLADVALSVRRGAPSEPRGYRLLRTALYLHVESAPARRPDGATSVPPPPDALFERLATMAAHAKWEALLEESEGALSRHRFSLDLHRHGAVALDALGHREARNGLVREVRSLLERVPELLELSFANGRPFADEATRRYFAPDETGTEAQPARADLPGAKSAELRAAFASALAEGTIADALAVADTLVREAPDGRRRFEARLSIARELAARGRAELARIFHQALEEEASSAALEAWDPELCLEHLVSFVEVERALAPNGAKSPRAAELVARIARISPSAVARWAR